MSEAKRKVLACVMSMVMAFSMMSATAMSAFADDLAAGVGSLSTQSSDEPIVYDTAYGVLNGKYALMMKTVTYEAQYGDTMMTYTATITDLMRADGEVTVHTNDAVQDNAAIPGAWTDLKHGTVENVGQDVMDGYVKVSDKTTMKSGVMSVDGAEILPCAYDSISALEDGFLTFTFGEGSVKYEFFAKDGTPCGSFSSATDQEQSAAYAKYFGGGYVQLTVWNYTGGDDLVTYAHKTDSGYVQDTSIAELYTYASDGGFLCAKDDGNVHYVSPEGTDTVIASAADVYQARLTYDLIELRYDSGSGSAYYSTAGAKLKEAGEGSVEAAVEGSFVFKPSGQRGDAVTYQLCSTRDGETVRSFTATSASALDAAHFYTLTKVADGDGYEVAVHKSDGTVLKSLGTVDSRYHYMRACEKNIDGKTTIVGYRTDDSDNPVYYDVDFNEVSYDPSSNNVYALPDGTKVVVATQSTWNSATKKYDNSATVTDGSGNPVKLGDYTLGIPTDEGTYFPWNAPKHGNSDLWWATDGAGKWGAVDSTGVVIVPFVYESYYDNGQANTDYAMVREDGVWKFLKVSNGESGPETTMHRLYNRWSGEHFYTSDEGEYANLVGLGWTDEGTGWLAPSFSDTPVYRMYNPYAGEHHYCMKADERDDLVAAGWTDEGIGWYSDDAETTPLYREYNPYEFSNNHNYTTDKAEHDGLVAMGWVDEGYAWYGL